MYDYIIVGSGLFGALFAHEATLRHKKCLVIDKRHHVGGNIFTEEKDGINVHVYGAHIFHTSNAYIWEYVNKLAPFNHFINAPIANFEGKLYNLPFNMNTFNKLWGVNTPQEAKDYLEGQLASIHFSSIDNLEQQALSLVGPDIYYTLIKGYTEKQWGKKATQLPPFIIKRLPIRFTYNNNYFNDPYQGIPIGGYTQIIERLLEGSDVKLNTDFFKDIKDYKKLGHKLVFTGMIDEFYEHRLGALEYRSLYFETEELPTSDYQGNAVVNYCSSDVPYTRIIEHKHFESVKTPTTIITKEYPTAWSSEMEPYYPVNDDKNNALYAAYAEMAATQPDVIFGGRLGHYKYYNMDQVMDAAFSCIAKEFNESMPY